MFLNTISVDIWVPRSKLAALSQEQTKKTIET
jgi:hypothetical protein